MEPEKITPEEVKAELDAGARIVFIDNRSEDAWRSSDVKIPGALRIPANELEQHLSEIPQNSKVVTYCT